MSCLLSPDFRTFFTSIDRPDYYFPMKTLLSGRVSKKISTSWFWICSYFFWSNFSCLWADFSWSGSWLYCCKILCHFKLCRYIYLCRCFSYFLCICHPSKTSIISLRKNLFLLQNTMQWVCLWLWLPHWSLEWSLEWLFSSSHFLHLESFLSNLEFLRYYSLWLLFLHL